MIYPVVLSIKYILHSVQSHITKVNLLKLFRQQVSLNFIRPDVFHIKTKYNLFRITQIYLY
jgi:hypothetical protein